MGTGGVRHDERTDSELVEAVLGRHGPSHDPESFGILFDRWYDRCWNVARNIMRSDDLAAEVAQDAMLAGWQRLEQLQNPDAFGGWLLRITRNRALTRLEREGRSRATGDDIVSAMRDRNITQHYDEPLGAQAPPSVETALEIHDRQELVWAASAALGERDASLLDLHLRHGLTPAEIAEELGVEANAAHQQLFRLRNKLGDAIGSYLLWRNGRTLCRGLAAAVSGDVAFDRSVAKAVAKHQKTCEDCSERRAALVSPTKLFASVPLLVVPFQFKVDAAAALAEAGVPIDPSAIAASGPPPGPPSGPPPGPATGSPTGPAIGSPSGPLPGQPFADSIAPTIPGPAADGASPILEPAPLVQAVSTPKPVTLLDEQLPTQPHGAMAPTRPGLPDGVGWTTARSAWLKSLVGAALALLVGLALIALVPGIALSDLWPFGTESASIGSETLAGPATDESSTTVAGDVADPAADSGDAAAPGPTGLAGSSSTSVGSTTATTVATTATPTTVSSTTTASSTTSSTTTETTATTATTDTTATTADTGSTTSTDRDTTSSSSTSSSSTTETTQPPAPPRIVRFISQPVDRLILCLGRNNRPYEALWRAENAESVELFLPNGSSVVRKPSGSFVFCGQSGDSISLIATGPGGEDKASNTLG